MNFKKLNHSLVITVIVLLWITILVLVKVLFSDYNGFEWGSVSDWISTGANIVMAIAAYKGFVIARDYFTDIIKKDGYDLVKRLQLDLIPNFKKNLDLNSINLLDHDVQSYVNGGIGILQLEGEKSNLNMTLTRRLNTLKTQLHEHNKLYREIRNAIEDISTYGWELLPLKKEQLIMALDQSHILFTCIHNIVIYLDEILKRNAPNFEPIENDISPSYSPDKKPPAFQDINNLVNGLIRYQQRLYCSEDVTSPYTDTIHAVNSYLRGGKHLKNYFEYKKP